MLYIFFQGVSLSSLAVGNIVSHTPMGCCLVFPGRFPFCSESWIRNLMLTHCIKKRWLSELASVGWGSSLCSVHVDPPVLTEPGPWSCACCDTLHMACGTPYSRMGPRISDPSHPSYSCRAVSSKLIWVPAPKETQRHRDSPLTPRWVSVDGWAL